MSNPFFCFFRLMISCYISFLFIVISESVISDSVIAISFFLLYQIPFHQIPLYQFPFFGYISFRYIRVRYINFPFLLHQIPLYQFPEKMLHQIPLYQIPLCQLPHPRFIRVEPRWISLCAFMRRDGENHGGERTCLEWFELLKNLQSLAASPLAIYAAADSLQCHKITP